jgi:penicillin-binding protein 2
MNKTGRGAPESGKNGTRGKKTLPQWERYLLLAIGIIVMSMVFIARLAELQLVHGAQYREETVSRISTTGTIHAARGNIYDRNGVPIAGSRMGFCVSYVDVKMPNGEKNAMLLALWQLLDRYGLAPETQLDRYVDWDHRLLMVRDDEAREALIKMILVSEEDRDNLLTGDQILNYMRDKTFEIGVAPDPETGGVTRLDTYTDEEIRILLRLRFEILRNQPGLNNPMVLAEDVSKELMSEIEDRSDLFRGVSTYVKPYRVYYNARTASHILGYVGMATDREVRNFNGAIVERALGLEAGTLASHWPAVSADGTEVPLTRAQKEQNKQMDAQIADYGRLHPGALYTNRDIIGKSGIELGAETLLRGINGQTTREVDRDGRPTEISLDRSAQPGADIYLSIDLSLQQTALDSLQRNIERIRTMGGRKNFGDADAGAVVALDVRSGEVLAMASWPDYDPNVFLEGSDGDIAAMLSDPGQGTWNRAAQGAYPPGSTYKPLVAAAALESGIVTPDTRILANYTDSWLNDRLETEAGTHLTNLEGNQGNISLERALSTSSNMYFYKVGVMTGIDAIARFARLFGFGRKTGIEIDESTGSLASREYKRMYYNEDWYPLNTAMASIGQLYNAFTPLQLSNYVATIANGGTRHTPHLVRMALSETGEVLVGPSAPGEVLDVSADNLAAIRRGMVAVANATDGTAVNVFRDFPFEVAGKTGTSETGNEKLGESSHGLFVCYAPADDPEVAVAVVVEHGVWGAYTAPIARDVLMAYFQLDETGAGDPGRELTTRTEIVW